MEPGISHPEPFKRLSKQEKKKLKYQASKEKKRQMKKKTVLKKKQARCELLSSMTESERRTFIQQERLEASQKAEERLRAFNEGIKVLIDLSYFPLMDTIEQNSLVKQVTESVGFLRKCEKIHLKLVCVNTCEELKSRFQAEGSDKWLVEVSDQDIEFHSEGKTVLMLSPDAESLLDEVNHDSVFVVGGLVDRTKRKSQSLTRAVQKGLKAVRLPIEEEVKVVRSK
jgi:tRNA (guanine9-N1)-methyltransferase